MQSIMVFDIETIPDYSSGRKLYNIQENIPDSEVVACMRTKRLQQTGSEFQPLHLHKIVAISVLLRLQDSVKVWSLGDPEDTEKVLIQKFFTGIAKYTPMLVSWNGSGFDLPVLHYRALLHQVTAAQYWEQGDNDSGFKWNNYINRYHGRHTDIMDILACYNSRAYAPLDELAKMLGFPGKLDMSGKDVLAYYLAKDLIAIRNYCDMDVLNTYLVYLNFELQRGNITLTQFEQDCINLQHYLESSDMPHLLEFLSAWK